jgi:hypothetical protein
MYCSENCRDTDWSTVHHGNCNQKLHHDLVIINPVELNEAKSYGSAAMASYSTRHHLIFLVGIENIKKIAVENKPMTSLAGDPKTKGFLDGKFQAANLEALLSLEDNFDKLSSEFLEMYSFVSIFTRINFLLLIALNLMLLYNILIAETPTKCYFPHH